MRGGKLPSDVTDYAPIAAELPMSADREMLLRKGSGACSLHSTIRFIVVRPSEVNMFKFTLIAGALFVIPAPAISQIVFDDVPLQVQPSSASAMKSDWDKVECRAENALGSRLQKDKVCLTKWQWWTYEQETKQWIQSMERLGEASH